MNVRYVESVLDDVLCWLHTTRFPEGVLSLPEFVQKLILIEGHDLSISSLQDISLTAEARVLLRNWFQIDRLCLLAGTPGYLGDICLHRLQHLFLPEDLRFITSTALQLYPVQQEVSLLRPKEELLLLGWKRLCRAFSLPPIVIRAGILTLPSGVEDEDEVNQQEYDLPALRLHLALKEILLWVQNDVVTEKERTNECDE